MISKLQLLEVDENYPDSTFVEDTDLLTPFCAIITNPGALSFYESVPFAFLGSLEWEYFGENTLPSYNDIINTPVNGIFLEEIFYQLGSNILDDQTTGEDRSFREMAVAIITPTRFFSRLLQ